MATRKLKKTIEEPLKATQVTKPVKKIVKEMQVEVPQDSGLLEAEPIEKKTGTNRGALLLGGAMLLIGILLLLGELFQISFGHLLWPLFIIVPGVVVFLSSFSMGKGGDAIAIVGGILTSVGVVLFLQNMTGFWASWAYAWSLIAPTSIGVSQMIYGAIKKRESQVKNGWEITKVGLIIFAVGLIFFELILGLSGFGLDTFGLPVIPVVLIGLGVLTLILAIFNRK